MLEGNLDFIPSRKKLEPIQDGPSLGNHHEQQLSKKGTWKGWIIWGLKSSHKKSALFLNHPCRVYGFISSFEPPSLACFGCLRDAQKSRWESHIFNRGRLGRPLGLTHFEPLDS